MIRNRVFVSEMSWIGAITLKIVLDPAGETAKTRFLVA
jgi:hypothetical protein